MMKTLPFTKEQIEEIIKEYPTPFHLYYEKGMRENARRLFKAFSWAPGFREYFAVKANPNPHIIKIMKEEGCGADCSSLPELILAERVGIKGDMIMLTSNNTPAEEYRYAKNLGAILNLDDITHIDYVDKHVGLPEVISFRYNPGPLKGGNSIIGVPEEAKYGLTREQLFDAYKIVKSRGVKTFGLHTMIASNELNADYFVDTAEILFDLVYDLSTEIKIDFDFVNLGGGFGIPYRPGDKPLDLEYISEKIRLAYEEKIIARGLKPLRICMESGRMMTGPYGFLVTRAIHRKNIYKNYIGVDACMADLMRPAIYGAYHHITVLGKENQKHDHRYDVTGSLCENNDKFAIDRMLPEIEIGDILVIHDTGAHGYAMGFNYNGKLRSAELLLREDGTVKKIRRAETIDDYFATLDFSTL
ncbi:MAG TPA: diaminopimelate decarboxylase [Spirochaetota bacterium]|jgi:diaminopimelate decarboxylase|nr:diaminopimelate decarboxylase [Spirochaetota bacterium]HOK01424.1 diaminopimelate decarboxylase [Spirochaetota bacterium]HOK92114.1 diaminopimelate decarboxylase [Spirochaetota bacterium]HON17138.1 diaminopimelate decarboxylase [Spirochaetota bacterium]HOQ12000.1 diaminopimelate decarboxylase [Spirochaetota bacterium]